MYKQEICSLWGGRLPLTSRQPGMKNSLLGCSWKMLCE